MAPVKFGLFKARSRDYQEQPSTENLLHTSNSMDHVSSSSPIPSTSKGLVEDFPADLSVLNLDSEEDDSIISDKPTPVRRASEGSNGRDGQVNYKKLKNQRSIDETSMSTLHDEYLDQIENFDDATLPIDNDDASTTCDVNSLQFDDTSIAEDKDFSEHRDLSLDAKGIRLCNTLLYCKTLKKPKKNKKEEQQLRDFDMWKASNVEVMQNLLSGSGTTDEKLKWEAIATARGLCTLTDSCTCGDCTRAKYLAGMADGDGGLGAAPLFSAISVGCQIQ